MNILITNVGRRVYFVEFLLNLKKTYNNLNIHLADNDLFSSALYCKKTINHKIPLVSEGIKKYFNAINKIIIKRKINLIIPLTNYDLEILSLNKEKFKKNNCEVLVSSHGLVKKLLNKELSYYLCKQKGINVPNTYFNFKEINFNKSRQFIIKNKFGNSSIGIFKTKNVKKDHFNKNNIVQDFVYGQELHFDILNDFYGNYIGSCVKKKFYMRSGETDKAEVLYNIKFENLAKRISNSFKHIGNLDCDAIISKNGDIFFLDFNPRFGGGYPFTHLSGYNFIKSIISIILKKKFNLPKKPKPIKASKGLILKICK